MLYVLALLKLCRILYCTIFCSESTEDSVLYECVLPIWLITSYSMCEHVLLRFDLLYKSTRGLVTTECSNPCKLN